MTVRRAVHFAETSVVIDAIGARARETVEFACRHLNTSESGAEPAFTLQDGHTGSFSLRSRTGLLLEGHGAGNAVDCLVQHVTQALLDNGKGGLQVHAALLARGGRALLLPAPSGFGKSTLAAWLSARGAALASDELVYLPFDGGGALGLTRAIHLKRVGDFIAPRNGSEGVHWLACGAGELVHPEAFGGCAAPNPLRVDAIVFPEWAKDATTCLTVLPQASVARLLMEQLPNARTLPGHGFPEIARLARVTPGFRLRYGSLEAAEALLDEAELLGCKPPARAPR